MRSFFVACFLLQTSLSLALSLDANSLAKRYFGNDSPWYLNTIPFFETSDGQIQDVYYYRWKIFRSHQRDLGSNGFISTEFLDDVGWQTQPYGTLNDATAFHIQEARWSNNRRFKNDYASFIYGSNSNTRQFSESMADAVWKGYLVDGDIEFPISLLGAMQTVFNAWADSYDSSKGLYFVEPLRDATEYTISSIDASGGLDGFTGGQSFRPSINSYQFSNAKAIANIATLNSQQAIADYYNKRSAAIKQSFQSQQWNSTYQHFIDRHQTTNSYVKYFDFIRGRELVGYVPWAHDLPDDSKDYVQAWKHILNTNELKGPYGLRTVEPIYQYYMRQYRYEGTRPECQWNGPVWPYQMTQVLTGLGNLLDHYPTSTATGVIKSGDFTSLLRTYTKLHYNDGVLNLEEDYDPATGKPIVGLDRSPHYFHSGYIDIILNQFVGIRARADDNLEVNPLIDNSITYFRADKIPYHGHQISVQWDATGNKYGNLGLVVEIDTVVVSSTPSLKRIIVPISRKTPPKILRPISKSTQFLLETAYPKGTVSIANTDVNQIHDVIDGRVQFFTELVNGWTTPVGDGTSSLWYQVDFGTATAINRAEIAWYGDSNTFDVPQSYKIQVYDGSWVDVSGATYGTPVSSGITHVSWTSRTVKLVRIVFLPKKGKQTRLVECTLF